MKPLSYSDQELLEMLKKDNRMGFNLIYSRYWEMSFQLAYSIIQSTATAEDVVQEVFADLWLNRERLNIINLKSYILQAARFQVIKVIRHNKVVSAHLERDFILNFSTNIGEDNLAINDIKKVVDESVSKLPFKCREIFNLSRNNNMSSKEIAAFLGLSAKTVDNQINIALKKIKKAMKTSFFLLKIILALYASRYF